jgi:integrase
MAGKPWFRSQTNAWYVQIGKTQERLCGGPKNKETEEEAYRVWHELMAKAQPVPVGADPQFRVIANAFLEHSLRTNEKETYDWHKHFLKRFADHVGKARVSALRPFHVSRFLSMRPRWGPSTQRSAMNIIQACLNWAESEGYIPTHALKKLKKPKQRSREDALTPEQQDRILASVRRADPFWEFLFAMRHTGCRPSEISRVTAADVAEPGLWVLDKHKTVKKTGKPRIIFLTPEMVEMTQRLVRENPEGPLFRNSRGTPWRRSSIGHRLRKLAKKLNMPGLCAYLWRHSFCSTGLQNGVGVAQMAVLMGHTDTKQVMKVYQHLASEIAYMQQQAAAATAGAAGRLSRPPASPDAPGSGPVAPR